MNALLGAGPAALLAELPGLFGEAITAMIAEGVAAAIARTPVRTAGRVCAFCLGARLEWNTRHAADIAAAIEAIAARLGTAPSDPAVQEQDLTPFLPPRLRPGAGADALPPVCDAVTTVSGSEVCPSHHPAAAAGRPGLIAVGIPSVHAAVQMLTSAGNLPGLPPAPR